MADFTITGVKAPYKPMVFELDITNPPLPLVLLLNPESLEKRLTARNSESRVRWTNRSQSGYVIQTHHDELDVLSMSGHSALFYSDKGLTSVERSRTHSWENFHQLVAIYRNNGINYNRRPGRRGSSLIQSIGRVVITYDGVVYRGSFDTLSITEGQERPFNFDFSLEFKVTQHTNLGGQANEILDPILAAQNPFITTDRTLGQSRTEIDEAVRRLRGTF